MENITKIYVITWRAWNISIALAASISIFLVGGGTSVVFLFYKYLFAKGSDENMLLGWEKILLQEAEIVFLPLKTLI